MLFSDKLFFEYFLKPSQRLYFANGLSQYNAGDFDAAFQNFTLAIHHDSSNLEAMKKRAFIHFNRDEIECCLIECEEILKFGDFNDVIELKENAKNEIDSKIPWYKVYGVTEQTPKSVVEETYRKLAKRYSARAKDNRGKLDVDKRKLERKLVILNGAKSEYIAQLP